MTPSDQQQTRDLIDGLKAVCAQNGLGNDGHSWPHYGARKTANSLNSATGASPLLLNGQVRVA